MSKCAIDLVTRSDVLASIAICYVCSVCMYVCMYVSKILLLLFSYPSVIFFIR